MKAKVSTFGRCWREGGHSRPRLRKLVALSLANECFSLGVHSPDLLYQHFADLVKTAVACAKGTMIH